MPALTTRRLFTFSDFLHMEEAGIFRDNPRVELISGEVLAMSPVGPPHHAAVARATRAMVLAAGDRAIVSIQSSIRLDDYNAPQPDIVLARPRDDFYASALPGPGDVLLIVEVSDSSLAYDRRIKAALYAEMGIPEYWIADIPADTLLVQSDPHGKAYRARRTLRRGERIAPRLLPECEVPVDALLP